MISKSQGNLTCARNFGRRCQHHSIIVATFHEETVWDIYQKMVAFCDDKFNPDKNCVIKFFVTSIFAWNLL